ncbi:MAG: SidA/IucD/PvdA family monooxygenase [Calothrix sp. MO_167.B12]|nr:SidA/IucD/PvdA family monooxygenase [Calothrix sp. MO_167.B12]
MNHKSDKIWDLIGVGFGPANLALATIVEEEGENLVHQPQALFLESKETMAWHPDLLIPGATIQVSFLKDLITLRNPCSQFTFLKYLHEKNRLNEFVNLQSFFPSRRELNDYFGWAAAKLNVPVHYSKEVIRILPVTQEGTNEVSLLEVVVHDRHNDSLESYMTRNVVISTGGRPKVPAEIKVTLGDRIFHSSKFLSQIRQQYPDVNHPYRFVVVGSGQSGAEVFHYLTNNYPQASVKATLRSFAYRPMDDSSFINEVFFPDHVNFFYGLSEEKRQEFLAKYRDTNYSVADLELIKQIYELVYEDKYFGTNRLEILPFMSLDAAQEQEGCVKARFTHLMENKEIEMECDGMILATGYDHSNRHPILNHVADYLVPTSQGDYQVERSYRLATHPEFMPRIFLQGLCEESHGISDTLLSILPVRAGEIWQELITSDNNLQNLPENLLAIGNEEKQPVAL